MSSELETCLTKAISEFKVRDMLTKFGLPEDAEVKLKMYFGENSQAAATCPVPSATEKKRTSSQTSSVKEFKNALTEKFMNPAIIETELGSFLPDEKTLTLKFNDQNNNSITDLITVMGCRPGNCGRPWCGAFLVS
ncbi:hypothetical protein [Pleurocapsa sp. PCC 7319]|uniref:hypothetical protein n=1 Tax=Pleurocapsa sp. PCC 7319 TaxID=118161 RepID=UPI0003643725|nr:hypothetical protein [Pleurocapsa sp. PCC 7319]